ncbi:MAG: GAF domain-containing protein [Candidatus Bipolaricaulia bacterium]
MRDRKGAVERRKAGREAEAIAALSVIITDSSSLEELLDRALGVILEVGGAEAGGIYLLDEDKSELRLAAQRGLSPEFVSWAQTHPLGHGLTGRAGASRQPVICSDLFEEFPELAEIIRREGFLGQVSLPLIFQERLLGVVNLNSRSREALDLLEEELQLLCRLAERVAQAVAFGRLLERERARARREAALAAIGKALSRAFEPRAFLRTVLDELLSALELEIGAVYLIEGEEFVLASQRGLSGEFAKAAERNPLDHYILGRVIRSEEPFEVHEFSLPITKEEGIEYATYIPLIVQDKPRGVLIIGSRGRKRLLRPEEKQLLEAVGAQLSLALGQAEAYQKTMELKESYRILEEFHEEILERLPVGILRLDREGRIVYENRALREILGVPESGPSKALGRRLTELPNLIETGLVPELEALLRSGKEIRLEAVPFTSLYGKQVVLSLVGLPLRDKAGALDGALLLIEDVTKAWASERLRESLLEVANEILSSEEIEPILRRVARAIIELSPFQRAAISLYDLEHEPPIEGAFVQAVAAGLTPEEEARLLQSSLSPQQRKLAFSERFRIGNSYYIPHDQVPWGKELGLPGRVSLDGWHPEDFLFIPLRSERGIIGHISVDEPRVPQAVDEAVLGPLEVFASLSALAVERAARLQELQRQKERLREIYRFSHRLVGEARLRVEGLFQRALELLEHELDYDYATIQLLRGEELEVVAERLRASWEGSFLGRRLPLGKGLSGWAAAQRQPVRVNDRASDPRFIPSFPGIRAELVVPLLFGEELFGVIDVESKREGAFSPEDEELLSSIAAQLALSLKESFEREALQEMALQDPLTGLYNRRYLHEAMARELERSRRYGHHLALMMIDLDNFREVNNRYGHLKGDEVLRELAQLLRENVRKSDLVFRYGGDEFLILMPETENEAWQAVLRLKQAVAEWNEKRWRATGLEIRVGLSIGVTIWRPDKAEERGVEELLAEADRLLYREKRQG